MRTRQVNKPTVGWEDETQRGDIPDPIRHVLATVPHLEAASGKNFLLQQMAGLQVPDRHVIWLTSI